MLEIHLRLKDLCKVLAAYLQKKKEKIQKFKETADSRYIYQNELDKAGSQHDMAYRDFTNLPEEQLLIKYCVIKHLILLKIQNMMVINVEFLQ